ncbi:PHD and RING finger domain-containing protein 1 isoform X2 [Antennarius striatus]|uniref:PHD and RING finger domain-containing protein 1 isoform X2 n=1 Tax=Antennarius striatus TaxID=241820 RepID=UPI0035B34A03
MEDDDSQDEMINHNASHSTGRRAALWAISDDSDDDEESEEEDSDNSEEQEQGQDGEEDEEDEEGNDEEEGEDNKAEDGTFMEMSTDIAWLSSDEETEKCPICLNSFRSQPVATPENCLHNFCLDCILEWTKNANSCPVDRISFDNIHLRKCFGGKVKKVITVQKPVKEGQEDGGDLNLDQTNCEVCGGSDREDRLLLCDGCDAGYHMECLRPPLDSVPVEEWFCPECDANNHHSRTSDERHSDVENRPSTAHPAASHSQAHVSGPTRAIARTQQSERVRANVNRHRITQARTSQLAPTYLIQSTWLDDTINAVVAGLNTSVYIRDFTPRVPSRRRRTTTKHRKTASSRSKKGKVASSGVKKRRRKVRRTKSRKRLVLKKTATSRNRIANNLGIVKNKKISSVPTVYRPPERSLSEMRAAIGAAPLSIFGNPFYLDPFVDDEEEEQQAQVSSLLETKRRGIAHSVLHSHQSVAQPVTASLSRRSLDAPRSEGVVEASPVPDLLGRILSEQSMLLMDSSNVVINRDGSLRASKPVMVSELKPSLSKTSPSGDSSTQINPVTSPNQGDDYLSPPDYLDIPGCIQSSVNRTFSQSAQRLPSDIPSSASHIQPLSNSDHLRLQPPPPIRSVQPPPQRGTNGVRAPCPNLSVRPIHDTSSKRKEMSISNKISTKPMWVDVSVLPRIPKIKREDGGTKIGYSNISRNISDSVTGSNTCGMSEIGMNCLAGDKERKQSLDQQKGRPDGQAQKSRPGAGSSSSPFSNSFSSSSSGTPASHPRYSSSSSTSSGVSFRINSSGNSWHSRRLNVASASTSGESLQKSLKQKEDEAKKRQLHRDKKMLLASRMFVSKEMDNIIYDPFNPTISDSSNSEDESECKSHDSSSQNTTQDEEAPIFGDKWGSVQNKKDLVSVKTETQERDISEDQPKTANAQEAISEDVRCSEEKVVVKKESQVVETVDAKIKKEPRLEDPEESTKIGDCLKISMSESPDTKPIVHHCLVKLEKETPNEETVRTLSSACSNWKDNSSTSSSASNNDKQKEETKSDLKSCSRSQSKDLDRKKKASQASKECHSSSPEAGRGKRGDYHTSGHGNQKKEKENQERRIGQSRSRERRRARSTSESSQSGSPDKALRKKRLSRSRSKERRRSRSVSSSSSRECSRKKRHKQSSNDQRDGKERNSDRKWVTKSKRYGRSRSKSRSRSRSTSRSRDCKRGRSVSKSKSRSRSRSRERRKDQTRLQQSPVASRYRGESSSKDKRKNRSRSISREKRKESSSSKISQKTSISCVSSSKDTNQLQTKKKEKDSNRRSVKEEEAATVNKQEASSCVVSKSKSKGKDARTDSQATITATEMAKETFIEKECKKEKQASIDMFADSPTTKPIKKEETDTHFLKVEEEIEVKSEAFIKTETCEIPIVKPDPSSSESCPMASVSSHSIHTSFIKVESLQDTISQSPLFAEQPTIAELTVPIKQEVQQPSDSDDDLNVDVMLDNLDCAKSRTVESASVKKEAVEERKNEGGQVLSVLGAKSKTQVKRVTWNIQEPEGPQLEKSASKLALYKLRLKQEGGLRRLSSTGQLSNQDSTGVVSDSSKDSVTVFSGRPQSDGTHPEGSSRGKAEVEEGDLSRKDKYLKKLHMQERAIEEVKLAIKPFYQRRDINKDEYKEILRKAVQKVCHSKSGEINPVKVGNLVKAYVDKYKHARKHSKGEHSGKERDVQTEAMTTSDSP